MINMGRSIPLLFFVFGLHLVYSSEYTQIESAGACCRSKKAKLYYSSNGKYATPDECEDLCDETLNCIVFSHSTRWNNCQLCSECDLTTSGNAKKYTSWQRVEEDICQFQDGAIGGGSEFKLGVANGVPSNNLVYSSNEQECASLVKKEMPDALGATLYSGVAIVGGPWCYAEYGTDIFDIPADTAEPRYCFFVSYRNACLESCKQNACEPDSDLKKGCNQMYSCPHACMMREIGLGEDECKEHCNRNGQSGCSPSVNGYQFALCGQCEREGCNTSPTIKECEIGCTSYGSTA